jgi:NADH:ubiquinone oxidoreductase subunit 4 (subunit M)
MTVAAVILVLNSVFAASYYLWLAQRIIFKKMKSNDTEIRQTPIAMLAPVIILALLCVIIGLLPGNAVNLAEGAARALLGV